MSAILRLDKIPKSCSECEFRFEYNIEKGNEVYSCSALKNKLLKQFLLDFRKQRHPRW